MGMNGQTEPEQSGSASPVFREFLALALRNRWAIVLTALVGMIGAGIYTLQKPPVFEGTAMVLIHMKTGQQANPFREIVEGVTSKLANEVSILKTRNLARKVAIQLISNPWLDSARTAPIEIVLKDPTEESSRPLATSETVITRLQKRVVFIPEKESDIIRITATSRDPRESAIIVNTYAEAFQNQALQQSRSQSRSVREFLEGRLTEQSAQLVEAEGQVKTFMESSGVVSLDGESNRVVQELSQLEATRNSLSIDIESLNKKYVSMQQELPQQESSVVSSISQASDPYIRRLGEELAQLEVQRDVMVAQNDPAVLNQLANQAQLKAMDDQLASLRRKLQSRTDEFIRGYVAGDPGATANNPLGYLQGLKQQMLEVRFQLESLRSRRTALDRIISEYEAKFRRIPRQSVELARLQRERLSTEKLYGLVEEKYNEAAITEKSEYGYVEIIDRESPETVLARGSLLLSTLLGLLVGLGVAFGGVVLKETLDVRVRTPEQLQKKGYSILTEIPLFDQDLKSLKTNDLVPKEARGFAPRLHLIYNPLSFSAESIRRLRTNLVRMQSDEPLRMLLFSSPNPGEGKTTTLLSLALSLAEADQRTVVIDADLRKPMVHALLGIPSKPGLTDVARGDIAFNEAVRRNVVPNLDVLTCGTPVLHPSQLFGTKVTTDPIEKLRNEYQWILIDSPPVLVVNDAAVLSTIADGTILMVDTGQTRLDALERTVQILERAGGGPFGVVLGRFNPKTAYGAYYGSQKYGHYDSHNSYYRSTPQGKLKS
jgi:tyrosine-protein kinase Etk/Wzc